MSIVYHQAQKQKYRITLELDVMEDFDPHNINWDELFDMGGDEHCEAYVEDLVAILVVGYIGALI